MGQCSIPNHVHWQAALDDVDWQRVLVRARGLHGTVRYRARRDDPTVAAHPHLDDDACGLCLRAALMMEDQ